MLPTDLYSSADRWRLADGSDKWQAHYEKRWDAWVWKLWVYSWRFKSNFFSTFPLINLRNFPSCMVSENSANLIPSLNHTNPFHLYTTCLCKNNLQITSLLRLSFKYSYYLACRHFEFNTKFIFTQCVLCYSPILFFLIHSYVAVRQWTNYFNTFNPIIVQSHVSFHPCPRDYTG
jgi:hypothetical protein